MKKLRGQSEAARNARLDRGCCPTHGLYMGQIFSWLYPSDEEPYTIVGCPRGDCDVVCKAWDMEGPVEILSDEQLKAINQRVYADIMSYLAHKRSRRT